MADTNLVFDPSKASKRASVKALSETKVTRVLLVCVYNQSTSIITHDILYNAFSAYGKINRILIFDKLKVWKAFVEFADLESATEAKRNMNDFLLFNDGTRMNVYFSNLEMIQFQNNNSGGKDYTLENFEIQSAGEPIMNSAQYQQYQEYLAAPPLITHSLSAGAKNYVATIPKSTSPFSETSSDVQSNSEGYPHNQNSYHNSREYLAAPPLITHSLSVGAKGSVSTMSRTNSQFNSPQLKTKWWLNRDDGDDEILDMINQHQNEIESSKEFRKISEEDKGEDLDKDVYAQLFNHAFKNKGSHFDNSKGKPTASLSLKSQPFSDPISSPQMWQQAKQQAQMQNVMGSNGQVFKQNPHMIHQKQKMHTHIGNVNNFNNNTISLNIPTNNVRSNTRHLSAMEASNRNQMNYPTNLSQFSQANNLNQKYQQANKQAEINARINFLCSDKKTPSFSKANQFEMCQDDFGVGGSNYDDENGEGMGAFLPHSKSLDYNSAKNTIGAFVQENQANNINMINKGNSNSNQINNEILSTFGKAESEKKSQALYIKGLENKNIHVQMIYNVFSNFGNIVSIVFVKDKAAALLEFENQEFASIAKEYLNNIVFMGSSLRIFYSSYTVVNPQAKQNQNDPNEEVFIGNTNNFRFKKNKPISINPPSPILHISNLAKDVCSEVLFQHYFGSFGRVEAIKFMSVENRNTCLLKMSSVEESLFAMACLHDMDFAGRNIQISFTRCKL